MREESKKMLTFAPLFEVRIFRGHTRVMGNKGKHFILSNTNKII